MYIYNGACVKLKKTVTNNNTNPATTTTTDYHNGFQYTNNVLDFFPASEGYVKNTVVDGTNNYNYIYQYKDHLGNVRVSYTIDPADNTLKIMDESHYYPFGMKHEGYSADQHIITSHASAITLAPVVNPGDATYKYKYNGKELQDELGLNMYDMDARQYDPAIGRFTSLDPVVHYPVSPYAAFYNNPVYWADPTGMTGEHYNWDNGKYEDDKGKEVTFAQAMASVGLNENGSEKSSNLNESNTEDSSTAQVGLLAESFDFQNTTSNWQAAGVTGLRLTVTNPKRKTTVVEFEIEVGVPLKLANGTIISERVAQLASAEAANETATTIGTLADLSNGKFYDAPALVKATFAKLMQRNLNNSLKTMLELPKGTTAGARVNSTIQSNIKTKEAVWSSVSTLEALKVWVKSFF